MNISHRILTGSASALLRKTQLLLVASITTLIAGPFAQAATISWDTVAIVSGDSDVSTTGVLDRAELFGNGSTTVNGVTFSDFSGSGDAISFSNNYNGYGGGGNPFDALSASYKSLLTNGYYENGSSGTITLNNTNVGLDYQVQFWVNDSRDCCSGRTESVSGSGTLAYSTIPGGLGGVGSYVKGTFTGDAGSQVIAISANASAQVNGLQLRATGVTAANTATITAPRNWATLTVGAGGLLKYNLSSDSTQSTVISGAGSLEKTGAGTLTLTGTQTYGGATNITGGTLKLGAVVVAPPVAGYSQWFDASTLTGSNGASISTWTNRGTGGDATVPSGNGAPTLISNAGTGTGLSALQFNPGGDANNSQALTFTRDTNARTVFSIFKGSGFLLTDSNEYDLHRPSDNNPADPLLASYGQIDYLGTVRVNGVQVDSTVDAMPTNLHNGYNLISLATNGNPLQLNGFNKDRVYHSGDQSQAEVVIYDTVLGSTDRLAVEGYLNYKWFGIGSPGGSLIAGGSLPSASPVTIASGATLDLNGATQQIASLTGPSGASVTNSGSTDSLLTISGASSTTFGGVISDGATKKISLVKSGSGTVTLSGVNTYTGATTVNDGTLLVNGSISGSAVTVNGGTLGGSGGTVGAVTVASGGTVAPGASTGLLTTTGNATFTSGATLAIEINGTTAGTGYDRLIVGGDVALGGATLSLSVGFTPVSQVDIFTLILNNGVNPVSGTFTGLANGDTITVGAQDYQISYFDDASTLGFELLGGNDVSLYAVPEPASVLTLLGGLGVLGVLRRRRS